MTITNISSNPVSTNSSETAVTIHGTTSAQLSAGPLLEGQGYPAYLGCSGGTDDSLIVLAAEDILISPHAYAPEGPRLPMWDLFALVAGQSSAVQIATGITAVKYGAMVSLMFNGVQCKLPVSGAYDNNLMGTLPEGYRPTSKYTALAYLNSDCVLCNVYAMPDGRILAAPQTHGTSVPNDLNCAMTFIANSPEPVA